MSVADDAFALAEAAQPEKEDARGIIRQLGYNAVDANKIILTDADIMNEILPQLKEKSSTNTNCKKAGRPKKSVKTVTSSMVTFVSGHGNDLDVATRTTIVNAIMENEFTFPQVNDQGVVTKQKAKKTSYYDILVPNAFNTADELREAFEHYIEASIYMQMAMGEPGPSAPMSLAGEQESGWLTEFSACDKSNVCLSGFSSSEVDIFIVENAYILLQQYLTSKPPSEIPTDCDLIEFNKVIRHILRANFLDIWTESVREQTGEDMWKVHYLRLLQETKKHPDNPEIWVLKRINKFSYDRYYQLKPNEGEEPEYQVHEGLHIFDLRGADGVEVKNVVDLKWNKSLKKEKQKGNPALDTNNLKNPAAKDRFFSYVKTKFPIVGANAAKNKSIIRAIAGILYSIEKKELYLSEICLLGFLLDIKMLTVYDPACRPITHTVFDKEGNEVFSKTRSGFVRQTDEIIKYPDSLTRQFTQ
jgi:hypothetical protein